MFYRTVTWSQLQKLNWGQVTLRQNSENQTLWSANFRDVLPNCNLAPVAKAQLGSGYSSTKLRESNIFIPLTFVVFYRTVTWSKLQKLNWDQVTVRQNSENQTLWSANFRDVLPNCNLAPVAKAQLGPGYPSTKLGESNTLIRLLSWCFTEL